MVIHKAVTPKVVIRKAVIHKVVIPKVVIPKAVIRSRVHIHLSRAFNRVMEIQAAGMWEVSGKMVRSKGSISMINPSGKGLSERSTQS